jgi:hypothetical protein
VTYRTWGGDRCRSLLRGFLKCSLGQVLALKPIIKVPKIISFPALLKLVKVVTEVVTIIHFIIVVAGGILGSLSGVRSKVL